MKTKTEKPDLSLLELYPPKKREDGIGILRFLLPDVCCPIEWEKFKVGRPTNKAKEKRKLNEDWWIAYYASQPKQQHQVKIKYVQRCFNNE